MFQIICPATEAVFCFIYNIRKDAPNMETETKWQPIYSRGEMLLILKHGGCNNVDITLSNFFLVFSEILSYQSEKGFSRLKKFLLFLFAIDFCFYRLSFIYVIASIVFVHFTKALENIFYIVDFSITYNL